MTSPASLMIAHRNDVSLYWLKSLAISLGANTAYSDWQPDPPGLHKQGAPDAWDRAEIHTSRREERGIVYMRFTCTLALTMQRSSFHCSGIVAISSMHCTPCGQEWFGSLGRASFHYIFGNVSGLLPWFSVQGCHPIFLRKGTFETPRVREEEL